MKQQLTKKQSRSLIELGIPVKRATGSILDDSQIFCPVFTIGDLLGILPTTIEIRYYITFVWCDEEKVWCTSYDKVKKSGRMYIMVHFENAELIDALFDLAVWCIENGYIIPETITITD